MILIDGKKTAKDIRAELGAEITEAAAKGVRAPGLAVILVGEDPASQVYVRNKEKACREIGINSVAHRLPASTTQEELLSLISRLNADGNIDGILLQLPLPKGLDANACLLAIDPEKDVDGFHPVSVGRLVQNLPGFVSCTPAGIIELLKRYDLPTDGKKAVVIGRSNIVGKPLAVLLARPGRYGNATVTLCHSHTPDLAAECRQADFIFAAIGKPRFVTRDMASAITPVPGGVGPMTIAMLLRNTLQSWHQRTGYGL